MVDNSRDTRGSPAGALGVGRLSSPDSSRDSLIGSHQRCRSVRWATSALDEYAHKDAISRKVFRQATAAVEYSGMWQSLGDIRMKGSVAKLCEVRTLHRVTGLDPELWRI